MYVVKRFFNRDRVWKSSEQVLSSTNEFHNIGRPFFLINLRNSINNTIKKYVDEQKNRDFREDFQHCRFINMVIKKSII